MKYQYLFFISLNIFPLLNYIWMLFSDRYTEFTDRGFPFIYSLSIIISLFCFCAAIDLLLKEQTLNANVMSLKKSREFYAQHARQLQELEKRNKSIQRTFQLQLNTLHSCISSKQYDHVREYLQQFSAYHQNKQLPVYCADSFINAILQTKKAEADHYNIHTNFHIQLSAAAKELEGLNETDLCSLLFNLLDNAVEACRIADTPAPFFELSIYRKGDILHFHMINSKNKSVIFNRKTTKKDSQIHGFGIMIIEEIAKKYNGYCLWEDKKDTFASSIMLTLARKHKEEENS